MPHLVVTRFFDNFPFRGSTNTDPEAQHIVAEDGLQATLAGALRASPSARP
jgi:hypothetical protein